MTAHQAPSLSDREHEELRLLYSVSVGDIAFFKQQQWIVTNYTVALYAGLVVIANQLLTKPVANWKLLVLYVIAVAVAGAGVGVLSRLQSSIEVRRKRLSAVRDRLSEAFREAWDQKKKSDDIVLLHRAVILVGVVISLWLIGGEA